jgi:hypothetical protein
MPLADPRACWPRARLRDNIRDDYMLVDIAPSLLGQALGLGNRDVTQLLLAARHRGQTLYPVSEWPLFVYVARIVDNEVLKSHAFTSRQIQPIAWGAIFCARKDAEQYAAQYRER